MTTSSAPNSQSMLDDKRVRRLAATLVGLYVAWLCTSAIAVFCIAVFDAALDWIPPNSILDYAIRFSGQLLVFPFSTTYSSIIPIAVSIFPVIFARVCYPQSTQADAPNARLSKFGSICFTFIGLAFLIGAVDMGLIDFFKERLAQSLTDVGYSSLRLLISSQTSFALLYCLQLFGLRPA